MAQSFVTTAGTLIIPSASVDWKVQTANSGLSTTGVLMLVGEADAGPRFDQEASLQANQYGPDEVAAVIAKYQSGPLVDAFRAATAPANDPNITGSFSSAIIVKTNASTKATAALKNVAGGNYVTSASSLLSLADKSYGKTGNLIYYTITQPQAEVVPSVTFIAATPAGNVDFAGRVNGGAATSETLPAASNIFSFFVGLVPGLTVTGNTEHQYVGTITGTLALTVTSTPTVRIDRSVNWNITPVAGEKLIIPSGSPLAGAGNANIGTYVVVSATSTSVTATKLVDWSNIGTLTPPVNVTATNQVGATDIDGFTPTTVSLSAANPIDGAGKSLELIELTTGTDRLSNILFTTSGQKVSWVSKSGAAKLITSAAEANVTLNTNRQLDNIQEALTAGGEIAMLVGYSGTTATLTINSTTLSTTVAGGSGANLSVTLADFPTISDLVAYINSKPGYSAAVGTAILGQLPSTALDQVSGIGICTTWGAQPGRVKIDAYRFANQIANNSVLVQLQDATPTVGRAGAGLPGVQSSIVYLAGGAKGATADADVSAALAALEKCRGNFLVPLISRDATGDVADGLTDPSSSYTLAATIASCRSHVLKMSSLKRGRNRQCFLSVRDTFANDKTQAANVASFRCAVPFQDVKNTDATGAVKQFQPWMGAVVAAAMQAAGFYKNITRKYANISGAVQAAKDFDDQDDDAMEQALLAGLLPLRNAQSGGWYWVSDQTSYGKDSNFVFNSIQATYAADTIALTLKQRMENAFVGQSVADVSAALALAFLESVMDDLRRLKLIAPSDDAPKGFKNASIKINGTAMIVSLEVKLAGGIYFIPISFLVSQVEQSA